MIFFECDLRKRGATATSKGFKEANHQDWRGEELESGVPNGNNQTTEHFLSFSIDLLVEAA